jgi:geranylgeranyl transferase type-2 subunit alpha
LLGEEILRVSSDILSVNAEYYTAWNVRRSVILQTYEKESVPSSEHQNEPSSSEEAGNSNEKKENKSFENTKKLLTEELRFTASLIRNNPKSYWLWFHRLVSSQILVASTTFFDFFFHSQYLGQ